MNKYTLFFLLVSINSCSTNSSVYQQEQTLTQAEEGKKTIKQAQQMLLAKAYHQAIPLWQQVIPVTLKKGTGTASALTNLALAFYHTGQYEQAKIALRRAISSWESIRKHNSDLNKVTLFEQQAHSYRLLQKVLVAQGHNDEALVIAEASRGQAFVEKLGQGNKNQAQGNLTLAGIRQMAKTQNTTIVLYSLVGDEIRVLGTEANLPTKLYIWVVQTNGQIHFQTVDLHHYGIESIRNLVEHTRKEIIQQLSSETLTRSYAQKIALPGNTFIEKMHQLLIQPIMEFLPKDPEQLVTIIPQDALFLIPFPALMDAKGHYLIERHTLSSSSSIQALKLSSKPVTYKLKGESLIVGNPTMPTLPTHESPLPDLPGAQVEVQAIAKLLKTPALMQDQATEDQVLAKIATAPVIHFATHGLLDLDTSLDVYGDVINHEQPTARDKNIRVKPGSVVIGSNVFTGGIRAEIGLAREKVMRVQLAGALAFAATLENDGFLTSQEISQLKIIADLVVLSACDTGQGRITGDGVVGLSRAFMVAGAKSVVVSLWSIPDSPTAELMIVFYQQLAISVNKAQALRAAMLAVRKSYPHPVNWAAFTLMGATN